MFQIILLRGSIPTVIATVNFIMTFVGGWVDLRDGKLVALLAKSNCEVYGHSLHSLR